MDKETLLHIEQRAISVAYTTLTGDAKSIVLPTSMKVEDLELYSDAPRRFKGTFRTESINHFAEYIKKVRNDEETVSVFISPENMSATALLNLGTVESPGFADNRVLLVLQPSPEYRAILDITRENKYLSQRNFIDWFIDWYPAQDQEGRELLSIVRKITINSLRGTTNNDKTHHVSKTVLEQVEVSGQVELPEYFVMVCDPYPGILSRHFIVHIRVTEDPNNSDTPRFSFRLESASKIKQDMADEFVDLVSGISDDFEVYTGSFDR